MGEGVTPGKDPPDRIPAPAPDVSEDNAFLDTKEQPKHEDTGGSEDTHEMRENCEKDSNDATSTGDIRSANDDPAASKTSEGAENSDTTQESEPTDAGGASQGETGVFGKFNKLELNMEGEWTTVRRGRSRAKTQTKYAPPIGQKPLTGRRVLRAGDNFGNKKQSGQGAKIWTAQAAAAIRANLVGLAGTPLDLTAEREDEKVHAQYYLCALKKPKAMLRDGDQRPMTKKEKHTMFLWASKQIHLAVPPFFIDETHVSKEQDAIRDFHKNHLGYRLYMRLPVGTKWSHRSGQKLLVMALLEGCKANEAQEKRVLRLFSDVQEVLIEPNSQIVTLRFVRPDTRKVWTDQVFNFGKGQVQLKATDSFTSAEVRAGADDNAHELMYKVYLLSRPDLDHHEVRELMDKLTGVQAFKVKEVKSFNFARPMPHMWMVSYDQMACPEKLANVRRVNIRKGELSSSVDIHHPSKAYRFPCSECLVTDHDPRNFRCENKDKQKTLAKYSANVELAGGTWPKITDVPENGIKGFVQQMDTMRTTFAPTLESRHKEEAKEKAKKEREFSKTAKTKGLAAKLAATKAQEAINAKHPQAVKQRQRHAEVTKKINEYQELILNNKKADAERHEQRLQATIAAAKARGTNVTAPVSRKHQVNATSAETAKHGDGNTEDNVTDGEDPEDTSNSAQKRARPASDDDSGKTEPTPKHEDEAIKARDWFKLLASEHRPQKVPKPTKQKEVTAFFGKGTMKRLVEEDHEVEQPWHEIYPSPKLDEILSQQHDPRSLQEWLGVLGARVMEVPGNGACFFYALHCTKANKLRAQKEISTKTRFHSEEANYYKDQVLDSLMDNLPRMIEDGTVNIRMLYRRYKNKEMPDNPELAMTEIIEFIRETKRMEARNGWSAERWSGAEELLAAVWFLREPIFVLDVANDAPGEPFHEARTRVFVQMYTIEQHNGVEKACIRALEDGEAYRYISTFMRKRILPLTLIFRQARCHFQCVRYNESLYTEWSKPGPNNESMRDRHKNVYAELKLYNIPDASRVASMKSNLHIRGTSSADTGSGLHGIPANDPSSSSDMSDVEDSVQEIQTDDYEPVSPVELAELLSMLNPKNQRAGANAKAWQHANGINEKEYAAWLARTTEPKVTKPSTINGECERRILRHEQVLDMLRSLPYPEVALAQLPERHIRRLGREWIMEARKQTFEQLLKEAIPKEAGEAISEWLESQSSQGQHQVRWSASHSKEMWATIAHTIGRPQFEMLRSPNELSDQEWYRLVVSIMVLSTPHGSVAQQCQQTQTWIMSNVNEAQRLCHEIRNHDWSSLASAVSVVGSDQPVPGREHNDAQATRL